MKYGFVRVAAAVPELKVADCHFNTKEIEKIIGEAVQKNVEVITFPELCITGYTCGDLFFQKKLQEDAEKSLLELVQRTADLDIISIVGLPVRLNNRLYNAAVVFRKGEILGIVPKINLPNHNEFYEKRWFVSGKDIDFQVVDFLGFAPWVSSNLIFRTPYFSFAIEICEDLWMPIPQSSILSLGGADIIFNPSASNELIAKNNYRRDLVVQQSARCNAGYIYASAGGGESTTDVVFSGSSFIAESGTLLAEGERFSIKSTLIISDVDVERLRFDRQKNTNFYSDINSDIYSYYPVDIDLDKKLSEQEPKKLYRKVSSHPFVPSLERRDENCEEIFSIQVAALAKRWQHTRLENLIVGVSGGLDSTLALLVCVKTADKLGYDRKRVLGVTMPGFGTTGRTYNNALELMKSLGITMKEIDIKEASLQHFKDIGHDADIHDVTYENVQARERTQILMDLSNKYRAMVIGTGDLSEMALGWSTYNGDHMSMYAVNCGIPKTLVRYMVGWVAEQLDKISGEILKDVLDTPVSPELLPVGAENEITQITEDVVGPYELHDFFLYNFVRFGFTPEKIYFLATIAFESKYSDKTIKKWLKVFLKRFFQQQFKRSCVPDGIKVGSVSLSPRGDWRMPSDAVAFQFDEYFFVCANV